MIQNFINKVVNWIYRNDIAKFDQEHEELMQGKQFPDEETISKRLENLINYPGPKVSTDSYVSDNELLEVLGALNSTDEN